MKRILNFTKLFLALIFSYILLNFVVVGTAHAATYYNTGTVVSNNLLSGLGVLSINKFGYSASSIPANTGLKVQFSQDGITWKCSTGSAAFWDTLSSGDHLAEGSAIDLSASSWSGGNFYYKIQFDTTDTSVTPVLDEVNIYYFPGIFASTQVVSNVSISTATANGTITAVSGGNATVRGFKYGLSQADTWDVHGTGSYTAGAFTLGLSGLSPNTTYYVRAYATNPDNTAYGDWVSFSTGSYYPTATLVSTNLLSGQTVNSINRFDYALSSLPAGSSATVQFSQNASTWYSSLGVLNGSNTLYLGVNSINLYGLSWSGPNFYYKIQLSANGDSSDTPVLDDISVIINDVPKYNIKGGVILRGNVNFR